ncbi:MAG: protein-glutamate O-methyltransferase CheR [Anaerolineae bacterium]|nr:protein-glutamate O-methyltransferase CheR [Anaerolineae bacterium]
MINTNVVEQNLSPSLFNQQGDIPQSEQDAFVYLYHWIGNYTGLHFPPNKHVNLYRRLICLNQRLNFRDLNEMVLHLQNHDDPSLPAELARVISTNHSFFFRETAILGYFRKKIIPTLPVSSPWRIWSAAAASGEEAYTLAIMMVEELGLTQALNQVAILGTDISYPMITQAEDGVYHKQKLESTSPSTLMHYFKPAGTDQYSIVPWIKPICTFRRLNLKSSPWPFQNQFHVIFCRNVLYYFDHTLQMEIVERMYDHTLPGGWLITSVTENLKKAPTRWQNVTTGVYRKI